MDNLFIKQDITLSSGKKSDFKIECDALTDEDLECIAYLISKKITFEAVIGVPAGGLRLKRALDKYCAEHSGRTLICDDVLTTGKSMENIRMLAKKAVKADNVIGVVIFARGKCPKWIIPLFQMWDDS